ncbi:MAG: hypothetical protein E6K83_08165 [Thaumarchaeota archaeon]|nr:MAG: hypothetical protein E6K83_08165 [Nitrososphaerota archaeon]
MCPCPSGLAYRITYLPRESHLIFDARYNWVFVGVESSAKTLANRPRTSALGVNSSSIKGDIPFKLVS